MPKSKLREVSFPVSKWMGVVETKKTYKKLRDEYINSRLQKYENINKIPLRTY